MNKKIQTIFIGTPDFSVPSLQALINDERFEIISVISQPDKKIGRKQIITPPPIKVKAEENNISVLQPDKISEIITEIKNLEPDLIVVIAYGQIIPQNILDIPRYGCINVHGSLLPKYRGASCIQASILNGDDETGVTIMLMDAGLDTGPILQQNKISIDKQETAQSLHDKLSVSGAENLPDVLVNYVQGTIKPIEQGANSSYVGQLKKNDGKIDWNNSAEVIERKVRAFYPWPGTFSFLADKLVKIIEVGKVININQYKLGEFFLSDNNLAVQCGEDSLVINKIQLEGKKAMDADVFLQGNKDIVGKILQ